MPWRKKKPVSRHSFFSDQVVKDFSVIHCSCELYFPEPSVKVDEFGVLKEVCLSGETLQWSKHCLLHICEIPGLPPGSQFTLEDTGQDCEICLSVILNRSKSGDFSYHIRDKLWHEYSHKVGERWRRFVLKFDEEEENTYQQFEEKIKNILQEVNRIEDSKTNKTYLLVAIQTKLEKRKSSSSLKRHSRLSLQDLRQIQPETNPTAETEDSPNSSENSSGKENGNSPTHFSLIPPFDPAPFIPEGGLYQDKIDTPVNYSTPDSGVLKSITELCDSLHIHPNELPQTLGSILKSTALSTDENELDLLPSSNNKPYVRNQLNIPVIDRCQKDDSTEQLNSEFLPTEDLYVPMGFAAVDNQKTHKTVEKNRNIMEQSENLPRLHRAQEVAQSLQTAINSNDAIRAQNYAKALAVENVTVTIDVKLKTQAQVEKDKEFNLKVNIEDKESSGGTITLKVKATDTIRDLKNRMLIKHRFPVEVQFWIIGKRIPQDTETLEKCKIKHHGFTAFLYLISAKAAGINKEEFMQRQNIPQTPEYAMAQPLQTPALAAEMSQTSSRPGSSATPGSVATGSASSGKPKMEPRILEQNFNIVGKNEKPTPEKLQGQVPPGARVRNDPNRNPLRQTGAEIAQTLNQIAPQMRAAFGQNDTPFGESRQRVPVMHPEENEEPQQGWACPACTYINQPTRPGCELCASDRPADYEIPPDYVITEEEKKRLEMEAIIERQTREVPPGSQDKKYDSDSERDLDNLLQFHDALQDTLQRMPPPKSPQPTVPGLHFRRSSVEEIDSDSENILS